MTKLRLLKPPAFPRRGIWFALLTYFLCHGQLALATELPLWEVGAGVGAIAYNDYRGSKVLRGFPTPIPYFIYNGDFLKADQEGIRGAFLDLDWLEFNVSGNATPPVRNNSGRFGMPDLNATFEIGPSLDFHIFRSSDRKIKVDLDLPFRSAFALGGPDKAIGWTFAPRIDLQVSDIFGIAGWNAEMSAGPQFATRRYDEYFYSVATRFSTLSRPAYASPGGYGGTETIARISKRFPKFWVGMFLRYDALDDAAFAPSPLVSSRHYLSTGFAFAWIIGKSTRTVSKTD